MRDPAIQDMHPGYACLDSVNAVLKLRQHASSDISAVHQFPGLIYTKFRYQCGGIIRIFVYSFYVCQKRQFFFFFFFRDGAGCVICINVLRVKVIVQSNRTNDRQKILLQKVIKDLPVHFSDLSDISDILTV